MDESYHDVDEVDVEHTESDVAGHAAPAIVIVLWQQNYQHPKAAMAAMEDWAVKQDGPWIIFAQEPYMYRGPTDSFDRVVGWYHNSGLLYQNCEKPRAALY